MTAPGGTYGTSNGYVSNEIIALQLKHLGDTVVDLRTSLVTELQLMRADSVRRDVYEEQRSAYQSKLESIEKDLEKAGQRKWAVWLAIAGAAIALGKDLIVSVIQAGAHP